MLKGRIPFTVIPSEVGLSKLISENRQAQDIVCQMEMINEYPR